MGNAVATRTVQPTDIPASEVMGDRITPVADIDLTAIPLYSESNSRLYHLYDHCRTACSDSAGIRVIAASAMIVGFLLAAAPAALAPVGRLLATTPAALTRDVSAQDDLARDASNQGGLAQEETATEIDSQGDKNGPRQASIRSTTAFITWEGTNQALKCSFGLVLEGNTRSCQVL
jgi:hypothetical protein